MSSIIIFCVFVKIKNKSYYYYYYYYCNITSLLKEHGFDRMPKKDDMTSRSHGSDLFTNYYYLLLKLIYSHSSTGKPSSLLAAPAVPSMATNVLPTPSMMPNETWQNCFRKSAHYCLKIEKKIQWHRINAEHQGCVLRIILKLKKKLWSFRRILQYCSVPLQQIHLCCLCPGPALAVLLLLAGI